MTDNLRKELAQELGTPSYIYNEDEFLQRVQLVKKEFGEKVGICFSIKYLLDKKYLKLFIVLIASFIDFSSVKLSKLDNLFIYSLYTSLVVLLDNICITLLYIKFISVYCFFILFPPLTPFIIAYYLYLSNSNFLLNF